MIKSTHSRSTRSVMSARELMALYPTVREPLIHGLLRRGETMRLASTDWALGERSAIGLALAVAAERRWLRRFLCEFGDVLLISGCMSGRASAVAQIARIAADIGLLPDQYADRLHVHCLRGAGNIDGSRTNLLEGSLNTRFDLIIIDDPAGVVLPLVTATTGLSKLAARHNMIDQIAMNTGACVVVCEFGEQVDNGDESGFDTVATIRGLPLGRVELKSKARTWPPI